MFIFNDNINKADEGPYYELGTHGKVSTSAILCRLHICCLTWCSSILFCSRPDSKYPTVVNVSTDICRVTIHGDCTFSIQYDANGHCYDMCIFVAKLNLVKILCPSYSNLPLKLPLCSGNNHIHVDASFGTPSQYKDCLSRYGYFHDKDKTVARPSYLYIRNSYIATTF